jgi:hypothetical protein
MNIIKFTEPQVLSEAYRSGLPSNFTYWLSQNWSIWNEFCDLAAMVRHRGRTKWSARAIIHVLRWNRAVHDNTDPDFKINNNWTPNMARLYNSLHGIPFFQQRDGDMSP